MHEDSISKKTSELDPDQELGRPSIIRMRWTPMGKEYPNALTQGLTHHVVLSEAYHTKDPMGRQVFTD